MLQVSAWGNERDNQNLRLGFGVFQKQPFFNRLLDKSRVCPLLLDLEEKELDPPLKAFNATKPNKKDMLTLCKTINRQNIGNIDRKSTRLNSSHLGISYA